MTSLVSHIKDILAVFSIDGEDVKYNDSNDYGSIKITLFVKGNPHRFLGPEEQSRFPEGWRGNGWYKPDESFARHVAKLVKKK